MIVEQTVKSGKEKTPSKCSRESWRKAVIKKKIVDANRGAL